MQLQRQVYSYYKKKMYKGRTALARACDFIFLRLFFFAAAYVVLIYSLKVIWLSLFLSGMLTVSLSLALHIYKSFRLNRFINKEMDGLKKECLLLNIVMMDIRRFKRLARNILKTLGLKNIELNAKGFTAQKEDKKYFAQAFLKYPSEKTGANEILDAYKYAKKQDIGNVMLFSTSGFTKDAELFAKRQECITLVNQDELLMYAKESGMEVNDEKAHEAAVDAINKNAVTPEDVRDAALSKGKSKAYMFCGIFALAWSYIAGFRFYYPLIAIACFMLAFFIRRKESGT